MPVAPVTYHWAEAPSDVVNPFTLHNYETSFVLPAKHTLRRILINEPLLYWKRGSANYDNQEAYFINYYVTYGNATGAPVLYRTTRRIPFQIVSDSANLTEGVFSIHSAADLEVGMNERVQRGGYYSEATLLTHTWRIYSSGSAQEQLAGEAAMKFRALYSLPVAP